MVVSWDKSDSRIWFALWEDGVPPVILHLVVEILPFPGGGWDWAVWQADKPLILWRGTSASAQEAADAAEAAANGWLRTRGGP